MKHLQVALPQGWFIFFRDFQFVYSLTFFGYFWAVLRPVATAIPLIFVGSQFQLGGDSLPVPYPTYAFAGYLLWMLFWDCVVLPAQLMHRSRTIVRSTALAPSALLWGGLMAVFFNLFINLAIFLLALIWFGVTPSATLFLAPLAATPLILMGLAFGLPVLSVGLVYHDLRYGLGFIGSLLMWTAPVFHVAPAAGALAWINLYNPLSYLIGLPRALVLGLPFPSMRAYWLAVAAAVLLFSVGWQFFRRNVRLGFDYVV